MTGRDRVPPLGSVESYCLLAAESLGAPPALEPEVPVEHPELREFLGAGGGSVPARELLGALDDVRAEAARRPDGSYGKALEKALGRALAFGSLVRGEDWQLPVRRGGALQWLPLPAFFAESGLGPGDDPSGAFRRARADAAELEGERHLLELAMRKARLPVAATALCLLALAALPLLGARAALWPALAAALVQSALVVLRILVSGRAPVTNMYETVLFSGLAALLLGAGLARAKGEGAFLFAGLAYNTMTLTMMTFATGMLSDAINPLVPVLRDNFWLSTHVTTIILSYGALAVSWILANAVLVKRALGTADRREEARLAAAIYTCLKVGVVLLASGIILGGVWADYSWGRFWGWDPKETWSLIVLCAYTAILHGRRTSWIGPARFAPLVALAFLTVMMAWFGVNYILASGLHSYGFSEGGAAFLAGVFAAQGAVFLAPGLARRARAAGTGA